MILRARYRSQRLIAILGIIASISMLFCWGNHFGIFQTVITFNLIYVGLFFWITAGLFFVGFGLGGISSALVVSGWFLLAILVFAGFGVATGSYG
jgi:hypothetical protein